jgi:hypothetical protein
MILGVVVAIVVVVCVFGGIMALWYINVGRQ